MNETILSKYRGALVGLAIGDALGTTLEFKPYGTFEPIEDMVGGGPFHLNPGEWTDDTSMALCLADSLTKKEGFDPYDQIEQYYRWWKFGHYSSTGRCFDIGNTVQAALKKYKFEDPNPYAGSTRENSAGNGSIMRLAPVVLFYSNDPIKTLHYAVESSKITHGATACIDACRLFAGLILGALHNELTPQTIVNYYQSTLKKWLDEPLCSEIDKIANGSFLEKEPPEIKGKGYVVDSLEAALWAFSKSTCFEDGCLLAVNLGDDADTTGAVYGQLAGAYYGENGIPKNWRNKIVRYELIAKLAEGLIPKI